MRKLHNMTVDEITLNHVNLEIVLEDGVITSVLLGGSPIILDLCAEEIEALYEQLDEETGPYGN